MARDLSERLRVATVGQPGVATATAMPMQLPMVATATAMPMQQPAAVATATAMPMQQPMVAVSSPTQAILLPGYYVCTVIRSK